MSLTGTKIKKAKPFIKEYQMGFSNRLLLVIQKREKDLAL